MKRKLIVYLCIISMFMSHVTPVMASNASIDTLEGIVESEGNDVQNETSYVLEDVISDSEIIDQILREKTSDGTIVAEYSRVTLIQNGNMRFITKDGEDLESIFYTFEGFDGYWYDANEGFEFDVELGSEYENEIVAYANPMSGGLLDERKIPAQMGTLELSLNGIFKESLTYKDTNYVSLVMSVYNAEVSFAEDYTINGLDGFWAPAESEVKFWIDTDDGYKVTEISIGDCTVYGPTDDGIYSFTTSADSQAYIRIETEEDSGFDEPEVDVVSNAPIIESIKILTQDIEAPGSVQLQMNLSEEGCSKISEICLEFAEEGVPGNMWETQASDFIIKNEGLTYIFEIELNDKLVKGKYLLSGVTVTDQDYKYRFYIVDSETKKLIDEEDNDYQFENILLDIVASECNDYDFDSPLLTSFTLPESVYAGNDIETTFHIENEEAIGDINLQFLNNDTYQLIYLESESVTSTSDGVFNCTFSVPYSVNSGNYSISAIEIIDSSLRQNTKQYFYDDTLNGFIDPGNYNGSAANITFDNINLLISNNAVIATADNLTEMIEDEESDSSIYVYKNYMHSLTSEQLLKAKEKRIKLILTNNTNYGEIVIDSTDIPDNYTGTLNISFYRHKFVKDKLLLNGKNTADNILQGFDLTISETNIPFTLRLKVNDAFSEKIIRLSTNTDKTYEDIIADNLVYDDGYVEYKFENGVETKWKANISEEDVPCYLGYISANTDECYIKDAKNPEFTELWPSAENSAALCHNASVSFSVTDDVALDKVEIFFKQLNGEEQLLQSVKIPDNTKEYTSGINWNISQFDGGKYQLIYRVYDTAGKMTEVNSAEITVHEYTEPVAPVLTSTVSGKDATLTWEYNGDADTLKQFNVYRCNKAGKDLIYWSCVSAAKRSYTVTNLNGDTYYFIVEAVDKYGNSAKSSVIEATPKNIDNIAPTAVIMPEEIVGVAGTEITFSGSNSTDNDSIISYIWDFGDDETAIGKTVTHKYDGTQESYTVSLTVKDAAGNQNTATKTVKIYDITGTDAKFAKMTVHVMNGYEVGTPAIKNATVKVNKLDEAGEQFEFETTAVTDANGNATLIVPRGNCTVSVIADGFTATSRSVIVNADEVGEYNYTISMVPGGISAVEGSLQTRPVLYYELEEAGIDTTDPANQHVVEQTVQFAFEGNLEMAFDVTTWYNKDGKPVGNNNGIIWKFIELISEEDDDDEIASPDPIPLPTLPDPVKPGKNGMKVGVYPISEKFYLIIYGETHWLKEMYNVELVVINNSYAEDITDCAAELELPDGLSLASMIDEPQSEKVEIGTIPKATVEGVNSHNTIWYVRGDREGEYQLTANVTGNHQDSDGNKNPFALSFTTDENNKIKIYAGSALKLTITAQDTAYKDKDYYVQFTLENVSDKPIYNLSFGLTDAKQYEAKIMVKTDEHTTTFEESSILTDENFKDNATIDISYFGAGETIDILFKTTSCFEDDGKKFISDKLTVTEIGYQLQDYVVTTLEGSTTEIPTEVVLAKIEKDSFGEWFGDKVDEEIEGWLEDGAVKLIDTTLFGGVPVAEYGVKIYKYANENLAPLDANSSVIITVSEGAYFSTDENNVKVGKSRSTPGCVAVYTDSDNYTISADGKSMTIEEDAKIYVLRKSEGAAGVTATTTYKQMGINGNTINPSESELQTVTYNLLPDSDLEYVSGLPVAADIILEDPETTEIDIPYTGSASVKFPFLAEDSQGDYFINASNLIWDIVSEDIVNPTGVSIENGVLTVTKEALVGNYTITLGIEGSDKVLSKTITLVKTECPHALDDGIVTTDPTCTSAGVKTYTCIYGCGYEKTEEIPVKAHTEVTDKVVAATCTKNGKITKHCTVCKKTITKTLYYAETITLSKTKYTYNGKIQKPTVTVKDSKGNKISSSYYSVSYSKGRKNVGTYKVTIKFKGNYSGTVTKSFTIVKASQSISASSFKKTMGNSAFSLKAKLTKGNGKLTYKSSNTGVATVSSSGKVTVKGVGKATITITAAATTNYKKETKKITVTVNPKGLSLKSLSSAKNGQLTAKWSKSSVTGYQLRFSTSSSMSNAKNITIKSTSTVSKTLTGLSKGKKYYVQIRAYKKVGSTTYYSSWSSSKSATTMNAKISAATATVKKGKSTTLEVTGTSKTVTWTSSNKSVATVSSKGVVKGIKKGTATITAKVGEQKLTCKITVK